MKGVSITRKPLPHNSSSKVEEVAAITLLVAAGLILLPIILLTWAFFELRDAILPAQTAVASTAEEWHALETSPFVSLYYKTIDAAAISAAAEGYFEHEPLVVYRVEPSLPFFEGILQTSESHGPMASLCRRCCLIRT
ncbi:hypothetical protein [Hymenobacter volaticus]|uniref:Uncharacterized protein n=1 Tax=Hymenobacter volaticus TaxID=2932254 RepID=A0ABY4G296_9BACT|nr:hypothetical protein [Hymenobacter volaticus]UOQ64992.1 hypothetical protein MUN86_15655 [Hymenobacter volaticus]